MNGDSMINMSSINDNSKSKKINEN